MMDRRLELARTNNYLQLNHYHHIHFNFFFTILLLRHNHFQYNHNVPHLCRTKKYTEEEATGTAVIVSKKSSSSRDKVSKTQLLSKQ